jgi:hypothetical protein
MVPFYGALHLIPAILPKSQLVLKDPLAVLLKVLVGTLRSSTFLGMFVASY